MDNTTNNHIPLCLAVGAGAIGKSISGYIFSQLGYRVVFADISAAVIDDINRRGGYLIETAETERNNTEHFVRNVSAYNIGDMSVKELAINADYICTAIGPSGMKASLPVITDWIAVRNKSSTKPLYILLFENDAECRRLLLDSIKNAIGHIPQWLKVVKTSIERMTKPVVHNDTKYDIVAEKFIPVIANRSDLENSSISRYPQYFMLVRDVEAYYYRKLFTNNLGHAVISYIGIKKGYKTTCEAMNDKYITGILSGVFSETTSMLKKLYGFGHDEMQAHISSLYSRYKNPGMADSLSRLARDPIRKLSENERIVGAVRRCYDCGIFPENTILILFFAASYRDENDPSANELSKLFSSGGISAVLSDVCKIDKDSKLYSKTTNLYTSFNL